MIKIQYLSQSGKILEEHNIMGSYETYMFLCRSLEGTEYSSNVDWVPVLTTNNRIPNEVHIFDLDNRLLYRISYDPTF